ncbi:uncharacterized protein LOC111077364 [Drosophila obscura]|uniref:uncharacterized protein LOC111077364 n=1 Tax=Drosophila obscura TaxID=7282 RepID=UPI001BB259B8|nr:uncharacterized protein LOC111077364 [Drosophila obscura]
MYVRASQRMYARIIPVTPVTPCVHPVPGGNIPQSSGSSSTRSRIGQENQDILSKDACPSDKKMDADEEVEDESSCRGMHVMCRTAHQQMSANIMKKTKEVWERRQNRR